MKKIALMFFLFSATNVFAANTYSFTCNYIDHGSMDGLSIKMIVEDFGPEYPAQISSTKFSNDFTEIEGTRQDLETVKVKLDLIGSLKTGWSNYHNDEFNLIVPRTMNRGQTFVGMFNWQQYKSANIVCRHQDNQTTPR